MTSRTSRKLDEVEADIDDASAVVERLQVDPDTDTNNKLDELQDKLDHAADTVDDIERTATRFDRR